MKEPLSMIYFACSSGGGFIDPLSLISFACGANEGMEGTEEQRPVKQKKHLNRTAKAAKAEEKRKNMRKR